MRNMTRVRGDLPEYPVGSAFPDRMSLANTGVHRPRMAGICGGADGAESIVVSGGYVDDEDYGYEIVYTGHGGRDAETGRQIADQELTKGNLGLAVSQLEGHVIRVIRGAGGDPEHSPAQGFRYDGLYRVVDHWQDRGKDNFRIWRFRLVEHTSVEEPPIDPEPEGGAARRAETVVQRIVRITANAAWVKAQYDHRCQICKIQLTTPAGPYAEGAHIRPLGRPHHGPDVVSNILCLCPNHHVLFDAGAIYIDQDLAVRETVSRTLVGRLNANGKHKIDKAHLAYHQRVYAP